MESDSKNLNQIKDVSYNFQQWKISGNLSGLNCLLAKSAVIIIKLLKDLSNLDFHVFIQIYKKYFPPLSSVKKESYNMRKKILT